MQKHTLRVEKRTVLGKKVKKLRKDGFLPANVYGKDIKSTSVQVKKSEFDTVFKEAGETGLVDLKLDGENRPVLIHNVQYDYMTHSPLHADFFQVNLKEKVKTMVPLVVIGEPKAVVDKIGLLMQQVSEIEVEALPTDLPENIEINVEHLAQIDEQITVGDLKKPAGVEILTDEGQVVVKIGELVSKETLEQLAADAAAAEAAKTESAVETETDAAPETTEEETKTEGQPEQKPEEKKAEPKPAEK